MDKQIGLRKSAELGIVMGLGWALIFAGCIANVKNVWMAFQVAVFIFIVLFGTLFTAPLWIYRVIPADKVDRLGGGDGNLPGDEVDDETDP